MSKEDFKSFVSKNPKLITYVNNNTMTWQKFYEIYDLYGESNDAWDKYLKEETTTTKTTSQVGDTSLKEIFNMIKNVDVDSVKKGIDGVQKAVGLLQDIGMNKRTNNFNNAYNPRPMYRRFED